MADEIRQNNNQHPLDGASQTLPGLYSLPATDFRAITAGNGDGPGYEVANLLVPDLARLSATTTKLTSDSSRSRHGESVKFTATVTATTAGAGTPKGVVVFTDETTNTTLGTTNLVNGTAELKTEALKKKGVHNIIASYTGDGSFLPSQASLKHTVE
jgi:hypothetical protein